MTSCRLAQSQRMMFTLSRHFFLGYDFPLKHETYDCSNNLLVQEIQFTKSLDLILLIDCEESSTTDILLLVSISPFISFLTLQN